MHFDNGHFPLPPPTLLPPSPGSTPRQPPILPIPLYSSLSPIFPYSYPRPLSLSSTPHPLVPLFFPISTTTCGADGVPKRILLCSLARNKLQLYYARKRKTLSCKIETGLINRTLIKLEYRAARNLETERNLYTHPLVRYVQILLKHFHSPLHS